MLELFVRALVCTEAAFIGCFWTRFSEEVISKFPDYLCCL
jgi:hypothetical protein